MFRFNQPFAIITKDEAKKLYELISESNYASENNSVYQRLISLGLSNFWDELDLLRKEEE